MRRLAWGLALALASCGRSGPPVAPVPSYSYALTVPEDGFSVAVEATFAHAPSGRLVAPEARGSLKDVSIVDAGGPRALAQVGDGWVAPACQTSCTIRYEADLEALAEGCHRMDCARRIGDAVLGTAATWMLRPEPAGDAEIHVRLRAGDPARFATGLRADGAGAYVLRAHELGEAAYTAFGALRRSRVEVPGGSLDVVLLGPPLAMGDEAALRWVKDAAGCVARLYGSFPARATIFVVPVRGADEVVFGRVLSLAGGSVALLFGQDTPASAEHSDWVVVHELSHLGTASFMGEAHWLEEGLATYYEPILRERARWISEADLWKHFVNQMPRGQRKAGEPPSLEDRDDIDSTYWGGALFAFLADLRIRQATGGAKSLDDVLRAAHDRLGDATHAARLRDFLAVGDAATGTAALTEVYAQFATAGEPADLEGTWRALGVLAEPDGSVRLKDDAPLAGVRRAISGW